MGSRAFATIFVVGVGLSASLCVAYATLRLPQLDSNELLIGGLFAAMMAAATVRPVHLGFRLNIDLTTLVIIATALILMPAPAILVSAVGVVTGQLLQRTTWSGLVFNSGQVVLQVAAAVSILATFGWDAGDPAFSQVKFLPIMALAMIVAFLVNTTLVSTVIGLQARIPPWFVWRDALTQDLMIEQVSQFALGLVAAVIASIQVLILPLLIAPGVMLYVSASRKNRLEFQTQEAINTLADLVDQRDPYTSDHSRRVAILAREIATRLDLAPNEIAAVERAARVHDLGKLVLDLSLLNKSEPLTQEEWKLFRRHPADGANILTWFPEFKDSTTYVRHHHERWDGKGYPDGLAGREIPMGARVLAVADALDAMASARPYRAPLSADAILAEFSAYRDVQWDAHVVDSLLYLVETGAIDLDGANAAPRVYDGLGSLVQSS
jgi:HD-GYP domain-containing protein (c-di-GMP phosphodiesterase class II)